MSITGYGTLLKVGNGASPEVFNAVAEGIEFSWSGLSKDSVETTHTSSTGAFREYISGLRDGGEFSLGFNLLPADSTQNGTSGIISKLVDDDVPTNFQCVIPTGSPGTTWSFSAIVTGCDFSFPIDDRATGSATFKISGVPTIA